MAGGSLNVGFNQGPQTLIASPGAYGVMAASPSLTATGTGGASITGGVLTITRVAGGFGAKATAAPFYFNDIEGQTIGQTAIQCGMSNLSGDGSMPLVANDRAYSGTQSLKMVYPNDGLGSKFPRIGHNLPGGQSLYTHTKAYWTNPIGPGTPSPIFKLGRGGAGASYSGQPQIHTTIRPNAAGGDTGGDSGYVTPLRGSFYGQRTFGTVLKGINRDGWHTVETAYKLSAPGASDGVYQEIIDGTDNVAGKVYDGGGILVPGAAGYAATNDSGSVALITWAIPLFDGNDTYGSNEYDLWGDLFYVDTTLQRGMMTDNQVYSASTKFAIQIPTAWTDTQAVFSLRTDGFSSGSTGWVHMFNAQGVEVVSYSVLLP